MCQACETNTQQPARPIYASVIETLWPLVHNLIEIETAKALLRAQYASLAVLGYGIAQGAAAEGIVAPVLLSQARAAARQGSSE